MSTFNEKKKIKSLCSVGIESEKHFLVLSSLIIRLILICGNLYLKFLYTNIDLCLKIIYQFLKQKLIKGS